MQCEPGDDIVAERMRRCAAVTSMRDLLLEVDEVHEYLKSHGIVDQPINESDNIVDDAVRTASAVGTAPDTRVICVAVSQQPMRSTLQLSWQPLPCVYA